MAVRNTGGCRRVRACQNAVPQPSSPPTAEPVMRRWPHPAQGRSPSEPAEAELHYIGSVLSRQTQLLTEIRALLERMAAYCGFRDVVHTTPEHHDAIIAYTSQLMHVVAVAVCDDPDLFDCRGYEGGSFRDCTRVAALDVPLWTQLFSMNAPALTKVIEGLENRLRAYRKVIAEGDPETLSAMLAASASRKRQMNLEARRGDDVR